MLQITYHLDILLSEDDSARVQDDGMYEITNDSESEAETSTQVGNRGTLAPVQLVNPVIPVCALCGQSGISLTRFISSLGPH